MSSAQISNDERTRIESTIRAHHEQGAFCRAAELAIHAFGPELKRFLSAILRDENVVSEVYSQTCEDVCRGIPGLKWGSSFRTWAYRVARNACHRYLRSPDRRRLVAISTFSELNHFERDATAHTRPYLRTEVKDQFARIRESLSHDEQSLLTLRVDRALDWKEIAMILADQPLTEAELPRAAAATRKRFERLRSRLREIFEAEGLLNADKGK